MRTIIDVKMTELAAVLTLSVWLALSCGHVTTATRLPVEFVNHQPHHQTDDPAFRVFYSTGVSSYFSFIYLSILYVLLCDFYSVCYVCVCGPSTSSQRLVIQNEIDISWVAIAIVRVLALHQTSAVGR